MGDIVSRDVFNHLRDHMLDIHRKKLNIISAYTHDYDSYTSKLNFLNLYIREIESFLESASVCCERNELPFVILGSVVEAQKIDTQERIKVRVMLPKESKLPDCENVEVHTCFSDLGNALLLKRVGDQVEKYCITQISHDRFGKLASQKGH